jgi:phosphatidylglycerol:prolipoprotein diacylglycerol transferase
MIVLAILACFWYLNYLSRLARLKPDLAIDLTLVLVMAAIPGARLYHVLVQWAYYQKHWTEILAIWEGGLAIHGAVLAGALALWIFARRHDLSFKKLAAMLAAILPLGQAIGRWGNYFNQELYGWPTTLPWGIPIEPAYRSMELAGSTYFHPMFLYESLANLFLALLLWRIIVPALRQKSDLGLAKAVATYIGGYSLIRLATEFGRVDYTPTIIGLRWPQWVSLFFIAFAIIWYYYQSQKSKNN